MTYIKTLTVLAGLALLTACGGTPTATDDSSSSQTTECAANPFGASCITEDLNVEARITDCIKDDNAGDAKCANLTSDTTMNAVINTCLTNPFTDTCKTDKAFTSYADDARANRVSFCASDRTNSSLCTALTTCQKNPFHASCGAYFAQAKISHCEANPAETPCVNIADWTGSFTDTPLATAPVSTHTANQFLSGLTDTPPVITGFMAGAVQTFGNSLTLADNGFGGDATDGASFFWGTFDSISGDFNRYYAGIHASTDLGAPLNNISQAGIWTGWFRADGVITQDTPFDLTVTFNTATQGGTITAFINASTVDYDIDGDFNENGVITGTVTLGVDRDNDEAIDTMLPVTGGVDPNRTPGILTGLIGQDGVVAAFVSTTNTDNNDDMLGQGPFTGAFVALPPRLVVNTTDWTGSFGQTPPPAMPDVAEEEPTHKNQFLAGTATTLTPLIQSTTPTTLFITGSTNNGVAFFTENNAYYAGVLAGTNLGTPITETITAVKWTGQIRAVSSSGDGTLTANPTAGFELDITFDGTRGTMKTFFDVRGTHSYSIDGTFDDTGIISGDIHFGITIGTEDNRVVNTDSRSYRPGTLSGIIGSSGALGVFISGHETLEAGSEAAPSYSGGFFVTPPAP